MNPFLAKILVDVARKKLEKKQADKPVTKKEIEPLVRTYEVEVSHAIKEYIYIIIGVFSAGFGLKGFLRKYERVRKEDVSQMGFLTFGLNWIFSKKSTIVIGMIEKGMSMLNKSKFLKQQLIKKAI